MNERRAWIAGGRIASVRFFFLDFFFGKCLKGGWEWWIMFQHKRERTGWKKVLAEQYFQTARRGSDSGVFTFQKTSAQAIFCVLKKLKRERQRFHLSFFCYFCDLNSGGFRLSAFEIMSLFPSLCFASLPSCSVCLWACVCACACVACVCVCLLHAWLTVAATQMHW